MKKIIGIALLLSLLSFCTNKSRYSLSVEAFDTMLQQTKDVQLLDIRSPQEFKNYCIPGAHNIDFHRADFLNMAIDSLDKAKPVLVYCLSGKRSKKALEMLKRSGFTTVYELDAGLNAWTQSGKPVGAE